MTHHISYVSQDPLLLFITSSWFWSSSQSHISLSLMLIVNLVFLYCVCVCVAGGMCGCVLKWFRVLPSAAASRPLPSLWLSQTHSQWYVGLHLWDAIIWLWGPSLLWSRLLLTELAVVRLHRKVWGCPSSVYMICIMCVNQVLLWPSKTSVVWKKAGWPTADVTHAIIFKRVTGAGSVRSAGWFTVEGSSVSWRPPA